MRLALAVALTLACAGCPAPEADDYPVLPGGGGPGGVGGGTVPLDDAGGGPDDGGTVIAGRVCVLDDPRDLSRCAIGGADGITVTLGSASTTTAADGVFTITAVPSANLVWRASGGNAMIVPSVVPYGASTTIPAIPATRFQALLADNGAIFSDGDASIFVHIVSGGASVTGATGTLIPAAASLVFYDGANDQVWDQDATGAFGMMWIPEADPGVVTVAIDRPDAVPGTPPDTFDNIPLENLSITFVTVDLL